MKGGVIAAAVVALSATCVSAHRLDEYLEATILSVEKTRVQAAMTLTPGVSAFSLLMREIDRDGDGVISSVEQQAYAGRVMSDLSLAIDGLRLTPRLGAVQFPGLDEMKEGRGEIRIELFADLPRGGSSRRFTFENRHLSQIAAYQVNCLVPRDKDIRILKQTRDYLQSRYEVKFASPDGDGWSLAWLAGSGGTIGMVALGLVGWAVLLRRRA